MKIFVTGATGFIGINIVENLLAHGHSVVLFDVAPLPDSVMAASSSNKERLQVHLGDIRDIDAIKKAMSGADCVVHTAAITAGPERERNDPISAVEVNVIGTLNILAAARALNVRRVIHLSSPSVYGENGFLDDVLDEVTTIPLPDSLYGITKYAGERLAVRQRTIYGLDVVCLRPGYVFGPWERDTGARDTLSPILQVTRCAMRGEEAILPRPCMRDWAYSRDIADAITALLTAKSLSNVVYNASGPETWALLSWCQALQSRFPNFKYKVAPDATIELHQDRDRRPMSTARLTLDTGFHPRFSLDAAFTDYLDWISRHSSFFDS